MAQESHKTRLPSHSKIKSKFVPLKATHYQSFDALADTQVTSQKPPQSPFPPVSSFSKQKFSGRHSRTSSTSSVQSLDLLQSSGSNFAFETALPLSQLGNDAWVNEINPINGNVFFIDIQPVLRRRKLHQSNISLSSLISDISTASAPNPKPTSTPGTSPALSSKRKLKLSQLFPHRTLGRSKKKQSQQSPVQNPVRASTISLDEKKISTPDSSNIIHRSKSTPNSISFQLNIPPSNPEGNQITKSDILAELGILIQQPKIKASKSIDDLLEDSNKQPSAPLIVQSILPDSPAILDGTLDSKDRILSIENISVTQDNIHIVLDKLRQRTSLTFEIIKEKIDIPPKHEVDEELTEFRGIEVLSRLAARKETFENIAVAYATEHSKEIGTYLCMYMTLNEKNQIGQYPGMEDLIFYYPYHPIPKDKDPANPTASGVHKLVSVRGMFYTLADVVQSMSGLPGDRVSLKMSDEEVVHSVFKLFPNKDILIIVAPESVVGAIENLCEHFDTFLEMLSFQFGSISNAFIQSNFQELDHLCNLLFSNIFRTLLFDRSDVFISNLKGSQSLRIYSEIETEMNSLLNELDASDLSDQSEIPTMQRPYHTIGSCLYYKGYLICSHLSATYQRAVNLYCSYYELFNITSSQIVIWKEIFLQTFESSAPKIHSQKNPPFKTLGGKHFLLIIGLGHSLCAQILLAGPMATRLLHLPPPDPLTVDCVKEMLDELEKYGLFVDLEEKSLNAPHLPSINNPLATASKSSDRSIFDRGLKGSRSSLRTSGESTESDGSTATKTQSRISLPFLDSQPQFPGKQTAFDSISFLTSSPINLLFHYLVFDELSGIFLTPPLLSKHSPSSYSIQKDLVYIFHNACLEIQRRFRYSRRWQKSFAKLNKKHKHYMAQNPELTLGSATECGINFEWKINPNSNTEQNKLIFWVVGRRILRPKPCEIYICYQDATPQSTLEMAFKLLQSNII